MKYKGLILLVLISSGLFLVLLSQQIVGPKPKGVAEGLRAPDFKLYDSKGREINLAKLKGKTVFVHFWASWCKECRAELPSLQRLYDRKKSDPDFVFLGIVYREDPVVSRQYLEKNNLDIPIYVDPDGNTASAFGVTGVPETYIISPEGIVKKKVIGPGQWDNF
ncbi:MAG: TlpA family protein disulfide reductase [Nitrospirae bacterium]|nr:TlpA family protein disulfide reductase [Nitrospirota bacterium]